MFAVPMLVGILLPTALASQAPSGRRPPPSRPAAAVMTLARDSGYPVWRDANIARAREPLVIRNERYEILLSTPLSAARATRIGAVASVVNRCAQRFELTQGQSAALRSFDPWVAFDSAANGPYVTITVLPIEAKRVGCDDTSLEREGVIRIGLRFGLDTLANPHANVASVALSREGNAIEPVLSGRALVTKVAPKGFVGPDGSSMVRLYVRYEDLAPNRSTGAGDVEVRIWNEAHEAADVAVIPRSALEHIWHEALVWRSQRAAAAASPAAPVAGSFPLPKDATLRDAHAAYAAGRVTEAMDIALLRLEGDDLERSDSLSAMVHVGLGFLAVDDALAARVALSGAVGVEPCLGFAESVDARARAIVDSLRPGTRCTALPTGDILRAALVPGRAQRALAPAQVDLSQTYRNTTIGFGVASIAAHGLARVLHAKYEDDRSDPVKAYRLADEKRALGNTLGLVAYGVWVASGVHAVMAERAYARRLQAFGAYGGTTGDGATERDGGAAMPIDVRPAPRGLGLAIHFF
jgi:hypothetical protein